MQSATGRIRKFIIVESETERKKLLRRAAKGK